MKFVRFASFRFNCLALVVGAAVCAAPLVAVTPATTAPGGDPYTVAVNAYIDAATKEMTVVRKELETAEKQGKKEAYAGARAVYEKCDGLVTHLKTAGRTEFDPTKAEYERSRATLQKKLKDARHATAPAVVPAPVPAPPK